MELVSVRTSEKDSYTHAHLSECIAISALLHRMQSSEYKQHMPRVVDCIEIMNMLWDNTDDVNILCAGVLYFAHESNMLDDPLVQAKIHPECLKILAGCNTNVAGFDSPQSLTLLSVVLRFLLKNNCRKEEQEDIYRRLLRTDALRAFFTQNHRVNRLRNEEEHTDKLITIDRPNNVHFENVENAGRSFDFLTNPHWPCEITCFDDCSKYQRHDNRYLEPSWYHDCGFTSNQGRVIFLTEDGINKFRKKTRKCLHCGEKLHLLVPESYHVSANDRSHPLLR